MTCGAKPSQRAITNGCGELVNDLLIATSRADPNKSKEIQNTAPLHTAANSGLEGVVWTLLATGANKDAPDGEGESPLTKAAKGGHLPVVKHLCQPRVQMLRVETTRHSHGPPDVGESQW